MYGKFSHTVTSINSVEHELAVLFRYALLFFLRLIHLLPVEEDNQLCLLHQASKVYVQARYERDFVMPITKISRLKVWVEALVPATSEAFKDWVNAIPKRKAFDSREMLLKVMYQSC